MGIILFTSRVKNKVTSEKGTADRCISHRLSRKFRGADNRQSVLIFWEARIRGRTLQISTAGQHSRVEGSSVGLLIEIKKYRGSINR